ncbi:uncharacterized protein LOC117101708 [Anneissia japonica]|uniref:uncharacterized protein LOC117101708 n=1 Tax=Anneissia japonica TaxID=1529436 RepID=UPI0014256650|nr:uncharacterized protein LOC117101708 [Anneissia japonica]
MFYSEDNESSESDATVNEDCASDIDDIIVDNESVESDVRANEDCGSDNDINSNDETDEQESDKDADAQDIDMQDTEDESTDEETDAIQGFRDDDDDPLFPGSCVTKSQGLLVLLAFVLKQRLTQTGIQELLDMLNILFGGIFPSSKCLFFKNFTDYKEVIKMHFFCEKCLTYIGDEDHCAEVKTCPDCRENVTTNVKKGCFFLSFSVREQIKQKLEDGLINDVVDRNSVIDDGILRDITSGQKYRELCESAHLGPNDLTLQWNCDGAPVFKSSGYSVWPVHCLVDELPPRIRKKNTGC